MEQQMTEEQRKELEEKIKNMSPEELKEFQKQQCIFCQIISGKVPSKKVYEDDKVLAVLDVNPAAIGHVLLLPKEHYAIMPQIPDPEIGYLFSIAKHISQSMLRSLKVEGTNIFVANGLAAGQKAQHFMIHIIPRKDGDGVLNISEHLVPLEKREKAGEMVGNRMNELMGIQKEKVLVQKKVDEFEKEKGKEENSGETEKDEDEPAETEIVEAEFEEEKKSKKDKEETEEEPDDKSDQEDKEDDDSDDDDSEEEKEGPEEDTEETDAEDDDEDAKDDEDSDDDSEESDQKENDGDSEDNSEDDVDEDTSDRGNSDLDDIANLFK